MSKSSDQSVSAPLTFQGRQLHEAWDQLLRYLIANGQVSKPRGKPIREQLNVTVHVEKPLFNVLHNTARNLGYRAMVAEWLWISGGFSAVELIARYNARMRDFSDDGQVLYGAYGPRIRQNWQVVAQHLEGDKDTRQAILPIWSLDTKRNSKDVPCTLSMQFLCRSNALHLTVNMRSSDVWLGLPFDFYVFSQLQNEMACQVGYDVGTLTMNLGSSHLYEENLEAAVQCFNWQSYSVKSPLFGDLTLLPDLYERFVKVSDENITIGGETIWDLYAKILKAPTRQAALALLKKIEKMQDE